VVFDLAEDPEDFGMPSPDLGPAFSRASRSPPLPYCGLECQAFWAGVGIRVFDKILSAGDPVAAEEAKSNAVTP
jgi:hypothetical protein